MNEVYVIEGGAAGGNTLYKCECGWESLSKYKARGHYAGGCDFPKTYGPVDAAAAAEGRETREKAGEAALGRAELEEMMAAYKKQVEREFAGALVSLFDLVVESKERQIQEAPSMEATARLVAASDELRQAIASIKVMGGIEL